MELLGDVGHVESCFTLFRDSVSVGARYVHNFRQTYHRIRNCFGHTRWYFEVMWVMWNLVSVRLEIVLLSVQDRCIVCAEHTIGSQIVLDAPNGTPR
jgi:hypothetical protein